MEKAIRAWHYWMRSPKTMTTIGYGALSPLSVYCNIMVLVQSMFGLGVTGLISGYIFALITKPRPNIEFSRHVCVWKPDEDGPWVLQCRIVVKSALSVLTDAKLEAQFLYMKPGSTSEKGFRVSKLDLLHVSRPFFFIGVPTHVIDEGSPLSYWGLDEVRDKLPIIGGSCARRT